jgi:hypothetical protein
MGQAYGRAGARRPEPSSLAAISSTDARAKRDRGSVVATPANYGWVGKQRILAAVCRRRCEISNASSAAAETVTLPLPS